MAGNQKQAEQGRSAKATFLQPDVAQVLEAAKSLYADELRPFGRILLKRIRERVVASKAEFEGSSPAFVPDLDSVPLIDPKYLRSVCETCPHIHVEPAEGREYSVTLIGEEGVFVDPCSPLDPYPPKLWKEAAEYFGGLHEEDGRLPSGRYACAQVLLSRDLPFLRGKSLGEVCHIVQLAISQKKIVGYADGHLVPYDRSEECTKERCALRQQPVGSAAGAALPFASWEDLRTGLREILDTSSNPAPGMVTLSNVKRLFRSQLQLELCETVLGHSRVWELLQDPRLRDVCEIQGLGNGQAVVQRIEQPCHMLDYHMRACNVGPMAPPLPPSYHHGLPLPFAPPSYSMCASNRPLPFMPAVSPSSKPVPLSTTPVATYSLCPPLPQVPQLPQFAGENEWLAYSDCPCPWEVQAGAACSVPALPPSMPGSPAAFRLDSIFGTEKAACGLQSPTAAWEAGTTVAGSPVDKAGCELSETDCTFSSTAAADEDLETRSLVSSSGSSPTGLTELEDSSVPARLRLDSEDSDLILPTALSNEGFVVKNTFVDVSPRAADRKRRSQSVPRSTGASGFMW
mmetsp:Transcript_133359/g.345128  ORF Transcript_133359/g.345128 Transcript_133359/m.345128 type:complete len:571 (+) Transcript_133359:79-1791(+)